MTLTRFVYRCLIVALVILFFVAWTAVPEPELIQAGVR